MLSTTLACLGGGLNTTPPWLEGGGSTKENMFAPNTPKMTGNGTYSQLKIESWTVLI